MAEITAHCIIDICYSRQRKYIYHFIAITMDPMHKSILCFFLFYLLNTCSFCIAVSEIKVLYCIVSSWLWQHYRLFCMASDKSGEASGPSGGDFHIQWVISSNRKVFKTWNKPVYDYNFFYCYWDCVMLLRNFFFQNYYQGTKIIHVMLIVNRINKIVIFCLLHA